MTKFKAIVVIFYISFLAQPLAAQKIEFPFGEVSQSDLKMTSYTPDPEANAVILSDRGIAKLNYINGKFQIELERNVKIKILNSNGYEHANIEIPYMVEDRIHNLKASTYNLVNDSIKETSVARKEFITDKSNKYWNTIRIAFPNVSEGSVIEYQYSRLTENIYSFVPWDFQAEIPTRYSEFKAVYNSFFNFREILKGNKNQVTKLSTSLREYIAGYETTTWTHVWGATDVPAFRSEPYITGAKDHLVQLEFELAGTDFPGLGYKVITPSYNDLSDKLLERSDFGLALNKTEFLRKITLEVIKGCNDDLSKLKAIRTYVAEKILWDGQYSCFASEPLKKVFKQERGSSAEINMVLLAMLRYANIYAKPVVLSTRENGQLHPFVAMIQRFNHVVAQVSVGGKIYIVDATEPLLPFNVLPYQCLNKRGRIVNSAGSDWVPLSNKERDVEMYAVEAELNSNGDITGKVNNSYLGYSAFSRRKLMKLEGQKGYLDILTASEPSWELSSVNLENADSVSMYFKEDYSIKMASSVQPVPTGLIINPFLFKTHESNPFASQERNYPIDFGNPEQKTYKLTLRIPEGYTVDELPSSIRLNMPNKEAEFLASFEVKENSIVVQTRLNLNEVQFKAEDYKILRDFFQKVVQKQSELIILKKI